MLRKAGHSPLNQIRFYDIPTRTIGMGRLGILLVNSQALGGQPGEGM